MGIYDISHILSNDQSTGLIYYCRKHA